MEQPSKETKPTALETARDALYEGAYSALYSALQVPIKGAAQTIDHVAGTKLLPNVEFMTEPKPQQFGSAQWLSQTIGGAVGFVLPFSVVSSRLRAICPAPAAAMAATEGRIAHAAATGFTYDALFKPVDTEGKSFWRTRFDSAAVSAASFSTMSALGIYLRGEGVKLSVEPHTVRQVARSLGDEILAGVPAGIVDAQARSWLSGKGFADAQTTLESVVTFSALGGAMHLKRGIVEGISRRVEMHRMAESARRLFSEVQAKHGELPPKEARRMERIFVDSQVVPTRVPTDRTWRSGDLTGRFLPRSDARGMFLKLHEDIHWNPDLAQRELRKVGKEFTDRSFSSH